MLIPESAIHWDKVFSGGKNLEDRTVPSTAADYTAKFISSADTILELGCGVGTDAVYLAKRARSVMATDFTREQIQNNIKYLSGPNLRFELLNVEHGLGGFRDESFSVVFARQSLHYSDEPTTRLIFQEIKRVLTPNGVLFFEVKSSEDPLAGQVAGHGDVRHFFSVEELPDLLPGFKIIHTEIAKKPDYFGNPSAFLMVHAKKDENG